MANATDIIANVVCPLIGMLLANFMWITPLPVVLEARYTRYLGTTNPYPFVITIFNCVGWVIYGCLKQDFFLFFSNIFGVTLGLYYTITCLTVIAKKTADSDFSDVYIGVEGLLIFAFFFWGTIGMVAANAFTKASDPVVEASNLIGNLSSAFAIAYYAAPLSTIAQVFATRDASSLYLPMITINLINAVMWFFYGIIGKNDINIYGPNGIGMVLSGVQFVLCFVFPAKEKKKGQSWDHIWLLLQGKVPPTFVTSAKLESKQLVKSVDPDDDDSPL